MKWRLIFLLILLPGCVWRVGNWTHPYKSPMDFDVDKETCLIQMSLKSGKDYSDCLYTADCEYMICDCMNEAGWVDVRESPMWNPSFR